MPALCSFLRVPTMYVRARANQGTDRVCYLRDPQSFSPSDETGRKLHEHGLGNCGVVPARPGAAGRSSLATLPPTAEGNSPGAGNRLSARGIGQRRSNVFRSFMRGSQEMSRKRAFVVPAWTQLATRTAISNASVRLNVNGPRLNTQTAAASTSGTRTAARCRNASPSYV